MNHQIQNLKLFLFVIGGIFILLLAVFIIGKQKNMFNPVFKISSTFYNVSGLQVGNNIRFLGINVGTVDKISIISDSSVQVDMLIKADVKKFIKSDSKVSIGGEGIIGDRILIISQGGTSSTAVGSNYELISIEPVETDDIISSLHITATNAEVISEELAEIMIKINQGNGTLGRLIQDESIAENFSQTILNLKRSAKGLNENMVAARSNFLLKGYFKKKQKDAEKQKKEKKEKDEKLLKDAQKNIKSKKSKS